jgi:hypothetical protein
MMLPAFGERSPKVRVPVAILNEHQAVGSILANCYFQEIFAPRVSGKLLNIGAGPASEKYHHEIMFGADEYHTLEPDASMRCTFVASATDMKPVASEYYDWVISAAVVEHVDDPWAAAREHLRATKPGGYLYVVAPFAQVMHPAPSFGDYWRFTPQGMAHLFAGAHILEVETWGENPVAPNGFGIMMQKDGPGVVPRKPEYYWFEFNNDQPFELIHPVVFPSYEWAIHRLKAEPMNLAMQINGLRDQLYVQQGRTATSAVVAQEVRAQYCERIGSVGCVNGVSFFTRA